VTAIPPGANREGVPADRNSYLEHGTARWAPVGVGPDQRIPNNHNYRWLPLDAALVFVVVALCWAIVVGALL
jgi:hypothetical protein